jgi:hypothetical protein
MTLQLGFLTCHHFEFLCFEHFLKLSQFVTNTGRRKILPHYLILLADVCWFAKQLNEYAPKQL